MRRKKDILSKTILLGMAIVLIFPVLVFAGDIFNDFKNNYLKPTYTAAGSIPYIGSSVQTIGKSIYDAGGSFGRGVYDAGASFGSWTSNIKMPQINLSTSLNGIGTWASQINIGQTFNTWTQNFGTWWQNNKLQTGTQSWLKFDFLGGQKMGAQAVKTNIDDVAVAQGIVSNPIKPITTPSTSVNQTPLRNPARDF